MDVRIASPRQAVSIPIPLGTDKLLLDFSLSNDEALLFVRLYNPHGRFVGEVSFGYQRLAKRLYYSPARTTLNALAHELVPGDYRLVVDTPLARDLAKGLVLTLDVQAAGGEEEPPSSRSIPHEELQSEPAFDADGNAVGMDRVFNPERRYYRGDLHGHTTYSDGDLSEQEAAELLVRRGLEFMAMTEHNAAAFGHRSTWTLRIPSFELTLESGHLNVFGLESSEAMASYWADEEVLSGALAPLVKRARESGSVVSLNHPFLKPWHFTAPGVSASWIDTLEIINDPTYPESPPANDRAIAFLDFLWNRGYRIFGVGGSDAHNRPERPYDGATLPSVYGDPATVVLCEGLSGREILAGLREGRCYVARHVELDIAIRADGRSVLPGERLTASPETIDYTVGIRDFGERLVGRRANDTETDSRTFGPDALADPRYAGPQYAGRLIVSGVCSQVFGLTPESPLWRTTISGEALLDTVRPGGVQSAWWLRVDLSDESGHIAAYVNPVHFGQTNPPATTIDALIEEFDQIHDQRRAV